MTYKPTKWVDHVNSGNKYTLTSNADGSTNIEYAGEIIQQGTPVSAENLNHIEQGVSQAFEELDSKAEASHTHNYAGSSSHGGAANSAEKLQTARTINGVSFDGTSDITVPRSTAHIHQAVGIQETYGYVKICTIKVTARYAEQPIRFTVIQRGVPHYDVVFMFANAGTTTPDVKAAYYVGHRKGNEPRVYYVNSAASTWDIYINKGVWDSIYVTDYQKGYDDNASAYTLTWTDVHVSSLPSGCVQMSNAMPENIDVTQTSLYKQSSLNASTVTVEVTGLFTKYKALICNITGESNSSCVLPLSIVKTAAYPYYHNGCGHYFQFVDNNTMKIHTGFGQSNPKIYSVEIISLY